MEYKYEIKEEKHYKNIVIEAKQIINIVVTVEVGQYIHGKIS